MNDSVAVLVIVTASLILIHIKDDGKQSSLIAAVLIICQQFVLFIIAFLSLFTEEFS